MKGDWVRSHFLHPEKWTLQVLFFFQPGAVGGQEEADDPLSTPGRQNHFIFEVVCLGQSIAAWRVTRNSGVAEPPSDLS